MAAITKAEKAPSTPADELQAALQAVVEWTRQADALRIRLAAAESEFKREYGRPAPDSCTGGLWASVAATQQSWRWHRHELVNAPAPRPAWETAIIEARASVANAESMLAKYQDLLSQPGAHKNRQLLAIASGWADTLTTERQRLGHLIGQKPNKTMADRSEQISLLELVAAGVTLTL